MPLRIYVDAYSGYRADERLRQFSLDDDVFEIVESKTAGMTNAEYFKVRTTEGKRYILRFAERTELVTVGSPAIRQAESKIAGRCLGHE